MTKPQDPAKARADTSPPVWSDFAHIQSWVFDLDNTLYPSRSNLFAQVQARMTAYIANHLGMDPEEARALQRRYYSDYGTTLRGLMTCNGVDPNEFLSFVHDIDISMIEPNPRLDRALTQLPGRKVIFTNGSVAHAERILSRVGIARHFDNVFDIEAQGFIPKPDPRSYQSLLRDTTTNARTTAMFDDIARNLLAAHMLGMTTVWIRTEQDWSAGHRQADQDFAHHMATDITDFLTELVASRGSLADPSYAL